MFGKQSLRLRVRTNVNLNLIVSIKCGKSVRELGNQIVQFCKEMKSGNLNEKLEDYQLNVTTVKFGGFHLPMNEVVGHILKQDEEIECYLQKISKLNSATNKNNSKKRNKRNEKRNKKQRKLAKLKEKEQRMKNGENQEMKKIWFINQLNKELEREEVEKTDDFQKNLKERVEIGERRDRIDGNKEKERREKRDQTDQKYQKERREKREETINCIMPILSRVLQKSQALKKYKQNEPVQKISLGQGNMNVSFEVKQLESFCHQAPQHQEKTDEQGTEKDHKSILKMNNE